MLEKAKAVLLLRWVLIIATSYLVVFSRPLGQPAVGAGLFVAAYFASNVLLTELLPRFRSLYAFDATIVLVDTVMVSTGLALCQAASSGFYVMYFVVLFLSALSERLGLVVLAALLISAAHLYTEAHFLSRTLLLTPSYLLRVPFLFVVAMFFGHLVQDARSREREDGEARARERRMAFLSTVSHDLKNPLGVIHLLATALLDGDAGALNDAQTDLVRRLHASTRHVITLALNLIDVARIDAGQLFLHRRSVAVADIVDNALLLARSAAEVKGIRLESSSAADIPSAEIDPVQVERVISNLLGNAIKFTPSGGRITLSVRHLEGSVVLRIHDTGSGISAEEMPTLFEKYRQRQHAGSDASGLGLFIVKAIVEAHGGSVEIDSAVGCGTTVTVRLPIRAPVTVPQGPSDRAPRQRWWQRLASRRPGVASLGDSSLRAAPRS